MATSYSPKIITDGLYVCLDAGDGKSYSGSGSTWIDRAGNKNGTFINSPTFTSDNGGSILFDGSNDYLGYNTSTLTLEAWVKEESSSSDAYATILGTRYGYNISLCRWNNTDYLGVLKNDSQGNINFNTTAVAFDEEWHHIACTYNEGQVKQYVDGVLVDTDGIYLSGRTINTSDDNFGVGGDDRGRHFHGLIPQARIYNKALTDAEILQNYNATKGRFGI
jgi:hypothetical protein